MVRSKIASRGNTLAFLVTALFLAGGLSGCSWLGLGSKDEKVKLWRSQMEFVRLEARDGGSPNDHPKKLSREKIRGAMRLIFVQENRKDDLVPLFSDYDIKILGRYVSEGFAKASPSQDVTFAIQSWHKGFMGLKTEKVITGRLFYVNNQLNLIFGSLMKPAPMFGGQDEQSLAKNPDPRLNPHIPGLRIIKIKHKAIISTPSNSGVLRRAKNRPDWLVFPPKALAARGQVAAPGKPVAAPWKSPPPAATPTTGEIRQLREELDRMKQDLRRPRQGIPGQQQAPPVSTTIEKRLSILENLHKQGLITREQLEAKREQILRGL
jgi:hypothetical protein